jgi:pimeloyl-ACP methyl ester carboxylesterase
MPAMILGCLSARARIVHVNGLDLRALEWGEPGRPPLCFLHGGAAHAHWFDLVAPAFADRFHVLSLDQRGHGESQWASPPAYATEDFASDLLGLMDRLNWQRMTLVGHSMGGHNAMAFAAWHPERLAALAILDARPAIPPERLTRMHARGRRPPRHHSTEELAVRSFRLLPPETTAAPEVLAHMGRAGVVKREAGWVYRFDPACYARREPHDAWPLLERITAPTLVVRAELSPILTPDMAQRMLDTIPDASLAIIPGAHHHLTLDAAPAFVSALDAFLKDALAS